MRNTTLEPKIVWDFFDEICQIPRPSKKEEKIRGYLREFATSRNLKYKEDNVGNIVIQKDASSSSVGKPGVILQCHMDMVCEKRENSKHDFDCDPIRTYIDGDWLKAHDTTLGADNGAGMAAILALLDSNNIPHPRLEALFTVDEESGLTGAFALKEGFLDGKYLLNLDGEDGLIVGCAGGVETTAKFKIEEIDTPTGFFWFRVSIKGLTGGHSGEDINKGLANANQLLARFLWIIHSKYGIRLSSIEGGNLHNAIPREAAAVAALPFAMKEQLRIELNHFIADIEMEYGKREPNIRVDLESENAPTTCLHQEDAIKLISAIYGLPNGVISMSLDMVNFVETSSNLASIKRNDKGEIVVTTSQRSASEIAKWDIARRINAVLSIAGGAVNHSEGYPGWLPNLESHLLKCAVKSYERINNSQPVVQAIHAGLECGLFLKKYPNMEMISFGPTILALHSPEERISISSMDKFWKHLLEILKSI
ncbi:MAG: aminoacyl-histidine dipeptidase [Bacteroidales bacterium]